MNAKTENQTTGADKAKWAAVAVLFVAGLVANSYYGDIALPLRVIGWIVLFGALLGIATLTTQGKRAIVFSKDARIELRKVVWPNRQETLQTTVMVVICVTIMGILLWGLDSILLWVVGFLTGQRG